MGSLRKNQIWIWVSYTIRSGLVGVFQEAGPSILRIYVDFRVAYKRQQKTRLDVFICNLKTSLNIETGNFHSPFHYVCVNCVEKGI